MPIHVEKVRGYLLINKLLQNIESMRKMKKSESKRNIKRYWCVFTFKFHICFLIYNNHICVFKFFISKFNRLTKFSLFNKLTKIFSIYSIV